MQSVCQISHCLNPFSDAFCRCVVTSQSKDTFVVWCTRSPTWDMMLKYTDIELWGEVTEFAVNPPIIVLEVFDKDAGVSVCYYRIQSILQ